ncbi:glycoside hydrolase family 16 protein [Curvularia clavata]|uniref:endo-1,3(4)-beta-glucanase n=1 Tax=Curvularia clavata TaxID=95742 RepID=A0A9Q9DSM3_CURCL|nr:glycoside hydrolase family 16 protein [Curvularia clavata]
MRFTTLTSAAAFFQLSIAGYVLEDDYMTDFYGSFDFFTSPDPTEGFVKYVDEDTARQTNLINASVTAGASWGVDHQNECPEGRPSVRLESKKKYNSGLIVVDVAHMPFGCGTWPAFWTTGSNWPNNGEIDIIEGVNDQVVNQMTLHTGPGCQIGSDTTQFAGNVTSKNCDVKAKGQKDNQGCSIGDTSTQSYGAGLNAIGGGVYATQWTSDAISVYFFPRGSVPEDVLGDSPDPSGWGKPSAKFEGGCDIENTFKQHQIVFDTTFCGVWAGATDVWESSSCSQKAATCQEWVQNNPEAFAEAYWTINALKVYQDNGEAPKPKPSSAPQQSSAASLPVPVPSETLVVSSTLAGPTGLPSVPISVTKPSVSSIFAPIPTSETLSTPVSAPVASSPVYGTAPSAPSRRPSPSFPKSPVQSPTETETEQGIKPVTPPTLVAAPGPAPTGAGGMPGFQWPQGGAGGSNGTKPTSKSATSPPQKTSAPVQNSTSTAASPSLSQSAAQPTGAPVASAAPAPGTPSSSPEAPASSPKAPASAPEAPVPAPAPTTPANASVAAPVVPVVTDLIQSVQTVCETVYYTVTATAAPTPAPTVAARNVRMERFMREHRQRLTRHHAKY